MSAPVVALLIDTGYVEDECGVLEVTNKGWYHLKEARAVASRELMGQKLVPMPRPREGRVYL
jgi:hypothetical protein